MVVPSPSARSAKLGPRRRSSWRPTHASSGGVLSRLGGRARAGRDRHSKRRHAALLDIAGRLREGQVAVGDAVAELAAHATGAEPAPSPRQELSLGTRTWRDRVVDAEAPLGRRAQARRAAGVLAAVAMAGVVWTVGVPGPGGDSGASVEFAEPEATAPQEPLDPALAPAAEPVDPCADCAVHVDGSVVRRGDRWYDVGAPGDQLVVGDWWCRDLPTLALLRPSTGEIFVFESWAVDGPLAAKPVTIVASAQGLDVRADGACEELWVTSAAGTGAVALPEPA